MRIAGLGLCVWLGLMSAPVWAQTQQNQPAPTPPPDSASPLNPASAADETGSLKPRPALSQDEAEALRISQLAKINGRPYDQPSDVDKIIDYAKDTYGFPGIARSTARALYAQAQDGPSEWGTGWSGFAKREGSAMGITAIVGNVRLAMELTFHEDLRYIPCHGCKTKAKIENALLAEITARHDETGKRFFTLTPTVADFSGPIIAHVLWYPGNAASPEVGAVSARLLFASRIGQHLFTEFIWERRHKDKNPEQ